MAMLSRPVFWHNVVRFLLANVPVGAAGAAGPENIFLVLLFASEAGKKKHHKVFSWRA
jgi:hypothetical protein